MMCNMQCNMQSNNQPTKHQSINKATINQPRINQSTKQQSINQAKINQPINQSIQAHSRTSVGAMASSTELSAEDQQAKTKQIKQNQQPIKQHRP